ncbi:large conductance mechanosensitive channel [Lachnospiraceae bacterium NK3A20]|nr:large conductance mechanosensitive channel [Lachnospiraceae bacterium NK3A20]
MKKFFEEFKEFISRGNVMDMAVGVIIGAAFKAIVDSLVADIISPLLGLFGTHNLDQMQIVLKQGATEEATVALKYGNFITAIINFIIMALILFCIVKAFNKAHDKFDRKPKEEAPATKICPYCKSEIDINATRCPHCTSELDQ